MLATDACMRTNRSELTRVAGPWPQERVSTFQSFLRIRIEHIEFGRRGSMPHMSAMVEDDVGRRRCREIPKRHVDLLFHHGAALSHAHRSFHFAPNSAKS
jgi:hypothetical protein